MKKSIVSVMAAMCLSSMLPAFAAEGAIHNVTMFPVRVLGVGAGMAIGIPVAVFRKVADESIGKTNEVADKIGGKEHLPPVLFASVIGLPYGLVAGTMEGVYAGTSNAINKGASNPFSQDSMSFGELDD